MVFRDGDDHHVEIHVRDLDRSIAFWTPFLALLGYEEERWAEGVSYLLGEVRTRLLAAGVPLLYDDRYPVATAPGADATFCEDPDRIEVEVVAPPAA